MVGFGGLTLLCLFCLFKVFVFLVWIDDLFCCFNVCFVIDCACCLFDLATCVFALGFMFINCVFELLFAIVFSW